MSETSGATDRAEGWSREIVDLHVQFQRYFRGEIDSLDRVAATLADDFRIVDPRGLEHDRDATLSAIGAGHGREATIVISTLDHRLFLETDDVVVAGYVEQQEADGKLTRRLSTVVFRRDPAAPNGVVLVRVHETWEPGGP